MNFEEKSQTKEAIKLNKSTTSVNRLSQDSNGGDAKEPLLAQNKVADEIDANNEFQDQLFEPKRTKSVSNA